MRGNKAGSVERTIRRAIILPAVVATLVAIVFLGLIKRLLDETALVRHSEEVIATSERIRQLAVDMETGLRGYYLTRDQRFLAPRLRAAPEVPRLLSRLRALVSDNPAQSRRAATIADDLAAWERFVSMPLTEQPTTERLYTAKLLMDRVRADHDRFVAAEQLLEIDRGQNVRDTTIFTIVIAVIVAALATAILGYFIRRDLKKLQQVYESALAGASDAATAKDRMLVTVSHELRTPLTAILGWIQMLRDPQFDHSLEPLAFSSIEQSARLQSRVVEDLIDVSRAAAGKLHIEIAQTDVRAALEGAVESIRPTADAKRLTIEVRIACADMRTAGDSARLQQVFWNLINNAARFTPNGGRIDVTSECDPQHITVRVRDSGIGIDPKFLPRVFEPFAQQQPSAKATSGLGLGLGIARQLVELHGGTIRASSEGQDRGAEFVVTLPRRAA